MIHISNISIESIDSRRNDRLPDPILASSGAGYGQHHTSMLPPFQEVARIQRKMAFDVAPWIALSCPYAIKDKRQRSLNELVTYLSSRINGLIRRFHRITTGTGIRLSRHQQTWRQSP